MDPLAYSVGGLLYSPADNPDTAGHILRGDWPCLTSVALCLEDSIQDAALPRAEAQLCRTLDALRSAATPVALPLLFARVKSPEHLMHVHGLLGETEDVLTGYIFPKFDLTNAGGYLAGLAEINARRARPLFAMPILESRQIAHASTRRETLAALRDAVDAHRDSILNIRVGGNDFCNLYGLRRSVRQTIYDLGVVRDILVDIVNMFSDAYVVSGPVWEYYGRVPGGDWAAGLRRELELDRANGFFGKTAIHPTQLPLIYDSLKVSALDAADARQILDWSDESRAVAGNTTGSRMNEVKCHGRWAERIALRAERYGIREGD